MPEIVTSCPCRQPHELGTEHWNAFRRVTSGLPETVVISLDGRSWKIPRVYIALHGLSGYDVPGLAAQYGWEELGPGEAHPGGLAL